MAGLSMESKGQVANTGSGVSGILYENYDSPVSLQSRGWELGRAEAASVSQ
jgi:hypothetical protein